MIDVEGFEVEFAWELVYKSFAYTNHTVLPEALETWGIDLLGNLLPRHLELIYLINFIFLDKIAKKYPNDLQKLSRMSLIEESNPKKIRMANLSIVGSRCVNGVAAIHSELLKTNLFKDFYEYRPKKFQNKTNGVTPRRWIRCCNPRLAKLLTSICEDEDWILDMSMLADFKDAASNDQFQKEF